LDVLIKSILVFEKERVGLARMGEENKKERKREKIIVDCGKLCS